ncbi:MAG: hypothetical protein HFG41_01705 [Coprococcus sp.]|nr:hypothetical protein [Coprococcus sp.]
MEKKYGIGIAVVVLLIIAALSFAYSVEYKYEERLSAAKAEKIKKEAPEKIKVEQKEDTVSTQGDAKKEDTYYLAELNGYVVVYKYDKKTVFEYTNILLEDLPEELKEEIRSGKIVEGTQKLYGFLENYSS